MVSTSSICLHQEKRNFVYIIDDFYPFSKVSKFVDRATLYLGNHGTHTDQVLKNWDFWFDDFDLEKACDIQQSNQRILSVSIKKMVLNLLTRKTCITPCQIFDPLSFYICFVNGRVSQQENTVYRSNITHDLTIVDFNFHY